MGWQIQSRGRKRGSDDKPMSLIGKLVLTAFLSAFVVMGGFFATMAYERVQRSVAQRAWDPQPATVVASAVEIDSASNEPYTPRVRYRYEIAGKTYRGDVITLDAPSTNRYRKAQAITRGFPPGAQAEVWLNPNDPADAVLVRDGIGSLGFALFMSVFLLLFSGIPLAVIIGTWWPRKRKQAKQAKHKKRTQKASPANLVIFGGVFALAGGIALYFMAVRPLARTFVAQGWAAVPCVVERSAVLTFDGDDGNTYKADILYFYEVNGERFGSNRYSFGSFGSSSGRSGKQQLVSAHPVGHTMTCYVDPDDPTNAVLVRGLTSANWWGLFPLPFLGAGVAVMIAGLRQRGKDTRNRWRPTPKADNTQPNESGSTSTVTLRPRGSRIGAFFGYIAVTLFWNGIVSVFLFHVVETYSKGDPDFCLTAFLIPFVVVGLVLIAAVIKQLMLIFAPVVALELDRREIPLGGSINLRWYILGRSSRVDQVKITLVGEESATYTRGTDTITDTETFYERVLVGPDEENESDFDTLPLMDEHGALVLAIPTDTMHSFQGKHNKIVWKLLVQVDVPRWPDPKDKYTITVLPQAIQTRA